MRGPGLAEVRRAQEDGRWEAAYASRRTAEPPPDLVAAFDGDPRAREAFEPLDRTGRHQLILPLLQALTPRGWGGGGGGGRPPSPAARRPRDPATSEE
ncbi:YdeI/OmpD-associated family protein, partial [Streptomyces sp. Isolate_45]|uniref:YdeI/OmpD-associated family protein n=1 Tax=Streptomyces sp. Isolate_45 TaxID=2950111 RepID=UPI002481BB7D